MFKNIIPMGLVLSAASTAAMCTDHSTLLRDTSADHSRPLPTQTMENNMKYMDETVIDECTKGSFAGTLTFPQNLQKLAGIGVKSYVVDLSKTPSTKKIYGERGDSYEEVFPPFDAPLVASTFNEPQVKEALLAIQHKEIDYPEFLRRIMTAGVSRYEVCFKQHETIYFGQQQGDSYTEAFPKSFLDK